MEDGKLEQNGEDNLSKNHSQDTYDLDDANTEEIPRYKPREYRGRLFPVEVPSSKVSSWVERYSQTTRRSSGTGRLTWAINPRTLMRNSRTTHEMRVGMTGEILNTIILDGVMRSSLGGAR